MVTKEKKKIDGRLHKSNLTEPVTLQLDQEDEKEAGREASPVSLVTCTQLYVLRAELTSKANERAHLELPTDF